MKMLFLNKKKDQEKKEKTNKRSFYEKEGH